MSSFWILQIIFDLAVAGYILATKYFEKKEKESLLRLIESLRNLVEKQKQLIDIANSRINEHQDRLARILEDIRKKNMLLTELLTTIKNKSYEDEMKLEIIRLKNSGKSVDEIAKKLKMSKGEVELILKLYEGE
ncbi:helix-turn-helix domain-containing protein [Hippea alviniae]|uniref:helix-turn-helix domain-containing protein n=1 Tax=Hippea alviniae TaxID=1279027 RepID=UPI0003B68AE6|nr:helix-turn-helix domain-containing protein [Hippea alviniae]